MGNQQVKVGGFVKPGAGEKNIRNILNKIEDESKTEYMFRTCWLYDKEENKEKIYEVDGYDYESNIFFEFQGPQHYERKLFQGNERELHWLNSYRFLSSLNIVSSTICSRYVFKSEEYFKWINQKFGNTLKNKNIKIRIFQKLNAGYLFIPYTVLNSEGDDFNRIYLKSRLNDLEKLYPEKKQIQMLDYIKVAPSPPIILHSENKEEIKKITDITYPKIQVIFKKDIQKKVTEFPSHVFDEISICFAKNSNYPITYKFHDKYYQILYDEEAKEINTRLNFYDINRMYRYAFMPSIEPRKSFLLIHSKVQGENGLNYFCLFDFYQEKFYPINKIYFQEIGEKIRPKKMWIFHQTPIPKKIKVLEEKNLLKLDSQISLDKFESDETREKDFPNKIVRNNEDNKKNIKEENMNNIKEFLSKEWNEYEKSIATENYVKIIAKNGSYLEIRKKNGVFIFIKDIPSKGDWQSNILFQDKNINYKFIQFIESKLNFK